MAAIPCNDPLANCEEGNLFRFNGENVSGVVEGAVNGMSTGPLPHGQRMILPNTLSGTVNSVDLKINGTTLPVCTGLQEFNLARPQDVGVLLSEIPENAPTGGGDTEQDILVVEIPYAYLDGVQEGEIDVETASNGMLLWLAISIVTAVEAIDDVTGSSALYGLTDGMDFSIAGTDFPTAIADAVAAIRSQNGRAAVRALLNGAKGTVHVMRNAMGALVIVARTQPGLARSLVAGVAAGLVRSRMTHVVTGVRGQMASAAPESWKAGGRIPVVGFVIVGSMNVVQWYADPNSRGDWSKLFSSLMVDGVALVLATAAANFVAGAVVAALGGAAVLTLGSAALVVGVGIAVGVVVGMTLTWLINKTGLYDAVNRGLTALHDGLRAVVQGAITLTGKLADAWSETMEGLREMGEEIERETSWGFRELERRLMNGEPTGIFD